MKTLTYSPRPHNKTSRRSEWFLSIKRVEKQLFRYIQILNCTKQSSKLPRFLGFLQQPTTLPILFFVAPIKHCYFPSLVTHVPSLFYCHTDCSSANYRQYNRQLRVSLRFAHLINHLLPLHYWALHNFFRCAILYRMNIAITCSSLSPRMKFFADVICDFFDIPLQVVFPTIRNAPTRTPQ